MNTVSASSGTAVQMSTPRETRTSKSDEQLFGDYASAVRQLGVAADAANEAHMLLLDAAPDMKPKPPEYEALISRTHDLRNRAAAMHREVAQYALAQRARTDGSTEVKAT